MPTLPTVSPDLIKKYQDEISKNSSEATAKRKSASLNKFFDWATNQGHIDASPMPAPQSNPTNNLTVVNTKSSKNIGWKTWTLLTTTLIIIILIFLLSWRTGFPIPYIKSLANGFNNNPTAEITINNQNVLPSGAPGSTISANPAGNGSWNLYANLKLTDAQGIPQVGSQTISFKLYNSETDGTPLYTSDPQTVITDSNGSALISLDKVPSELFFQNDKLYLEPVIGSTETAGRIPVSTANVAANLGGYFPANPEQGATPLTVPVIDANGSLNLASQSPAINATAGNLLIQGQAVTLKAVDGSEGNIEFNPDGNGSANFIFEGNKANLLNAFAPNLNSGSLYGGLVANNSTGYDLLLLQSGSNPITRFAVDALGNATASGSIDSLTDLQTSGISRVSSTGGLENITDYSQYYGNFNVNLNAGNFAAISEIKPPKGALSDVMTITLDEGGKPASSNSIYSTLVLNRIDGAREAMALMVNGNAQFNGLLRLGEYTGNPEPAGAPGYTAGNLYFNVTDGKVYVYDGSTWNPIGSGGGSFDTLTGGTNTTATMIVGSGATLDFTGSGTINASNFDGLSATGGTSGQLLTSGGLGSPTWTNIASSLTNGTDISITGTTNATINDTSTLATVTGRGATTGTQVSLNGGVITRQINSTGTLLIDSIGTLSINTTNNQAITTGTGLTTLGGNLGVNGGSITTNQAVASIFNATATTLNIGGAATTINVGPTGSSGTVIFSGGSADTGCTLDGVTGNFTCSGNVTSTETSGTQGWWTQNLGALYPINNSADLLIGATAGPTATQSAKFAFTGVDGAGVPTASISGNVAGIATYITGNGNLSTTLMSNLTLGGGSTGNVNINSRGLAALTANGANLTTTGTLTFPNTNTLTGVTNYLQSSQGYSVGGGTTYYFDGSGNLNANAGTFAGLLTANGNTILGTTTGNTVTFTSRVNSNVLPSVTATDDLGSSGLKWNNIYGTSIFQGAYQVCDSSGANCPASSGTNYWQLNDVVVSPANTTFDLAVGGTATGSAFQVFGMEKAAGDIAKLNSTVVTTGNVLEATASAITTGNIIKLGQGGDTTFSGNAILADLDNTGAGGGGFTGNFLLFKNAGTTKFSVDSTGSVSANAGIFNGNVAVNGGNLTTNQTNGNLFNTTVNNLNIGGAASNIVIGAVLGTTTFNSQTVTLGGNSTLNGGTGSNQSLTLSSTTNATKGNINFFNTTNSIDSLGDLTLAGYASASGDLTLANGARAIQTTTFSPLTIGGTTTGNITLSPSNNIAGGNVSPGVTNVTDLGSAGLEFRGVYGQTLYQNGNQVCDTSGSIAGCGTLNYWQLNNKILSPTNSTYDLAIGGTATGSAFQVFGSETAGSGIEKINSSVTTTGDVLSATASAITTGNLLKLGQGGDQNFSGNAILADLDNTGAGGGGFTGNFELFKNAGVTKYFVDSAGNASESGNLTIGNGSTIRPAYGPLSLAYKSGANAWTTGITLADTTGNVGIGNLTPTSKLDVADTTITTGTVVNAASTAITSGNMLGLTESGAQNFIGNGIKMDFATSGGGNFTGNFLDFANASTAKFIVDSSGNMKSAAGDYWAPIADSTTALNIANAAGTSFVTFDSTNLKVGIGTNSPLSKLSVIATSANSTGKAAFLVDQYENQDILTASASGVTKMTLTNDGTLKLFNSTSSISNTSGDITIDAASNFTSFAGDNIGNIGTLTASTGIFTANLQVNNAVATPYNRLGSNTTTHSGNITDGSDLLISSDLELDGNFFLDGGIIANSAGTTTIAFSTSPTTLPNTLGAGNWFVDNTSNLGQAALMVGQEKGGDIFTASASGISKFTIDRLGDATASGNVTMGGQLQVGRFASAPTSIGAGSIYFNTSTITGNSNPNSETPGITGDLFVQGVDGNYHRVSLDMTQYSSSSANIANGSYIQVAHNQNTNDLSLTGWFFDTVSGLWRTISSYSSTIINNLNNQFNPAFTQQTVTTSVQLQYQNDSLGNGADGAITVSSSTNINSTNLITGRTCTDGGDAVNYNVSTLTSTSATLSTTPSAGCLNVGDEVLLINLQGSNSAFGNVGNYETLRVASVSTSTVNFTTAKTKFYGNGTGTDDTNLGTTAGTQRVMLQRVPNYTTVTVNGSQNFTPSAWNGAKGGVMFFRATGAVAINGTINADAKGYLGFGDNDSPGTGAGGNGGEAFCGTGGVGGSTDGVAGTNGAGGGGGGYTAVGGNGFCGGGGAGRTTAGTGSATSGGSGGGGGGYDGGGGGGGYGTAGGGGKSVDGTSASAGGTNSSANGAVASNAGGGGGGGSYGDPNLATSLMFGSAGGEGAEYVTGQSGAGGNGGGIVYIAGATVTVSGGVSSTGAGGTAATSAGYAGGGGGGAGGSVKIVGNTLTLGSSLVTAAGGTGANGNWNGSANAGTAGGNGGVGRIASYFSSAISGSTSPSYTSGSLTYNPYAVYVGSEIATPGTTAFNNISWTQSLPSGTAIQFQTRSGNTADSTDGTWEAWKPTTSSVLLDDAHTQSNWPGTNATVAAGDVIRQAQYFEDENQLNAANMTKITSTTAGGYAERTIGSTNISAYQYITLWVRATSPGQVVTLGFGNSTGADNTKTFNIDQANTWQKIYWDISNISAGSRNAVTKLRVTSVTNGVSVYFENYKAESYLNTNSGSTITSTANNYIQYRAILSTTNSANSPTLSAVKINLTNASGTVTINADRIVSNQATSKIPTSRLITSSTLPYAQYSLGTGADGAITVSSSTNINTTILISGRTCADGGDAVNYSVTGLTSTSATLEASPSSGCLAVGDEVLLINLRGTNSAFGNVGNYETLRVASVSTNTVNFTTAKTKFYGDGTGTNDTNIGVGTGNQAVMLQRVPNYTNVTVNTAVNFTPSAWVDPSGNSESGVGGAGEGGVMFFRATGTVAVNGTGTINADAKGYLGFGDNDSPGTGAGGNGGEAFCGTGGVGGSTDGVAGTNGAGGGGGGYTAVGGNGFCGGGGAGRTTAGTGSATSGGSGGGGGGYDGGGGGGGYGTAGGGGKSVDGTSASAGGTNSSANGAVASNAGGGGGGGSYGDPNLATSLMFGSAGGEGAEYVTGQSGAGGNGGGIVYIAGATVTVSGGVSSTGAGGTAATSAGYAGGGGGGAGGSVKIVGNTLTLGSSLVTAAGGTGANGNWNGSANAGTAGGNGGVGRIAVYNTSSISGSTSPTYTVDTSTSNYNPYSTVISKEIAITGATSLGNIAWAQNLPSNTMIQLQTRTGNTANSTDGTWEAWKPTTTSTTLDTADATTGWAATNATGPTDGNILRQINYYEDENINSSPANKTLQFTSTSAGGYLEKTTIPSTDLRTSAGFQYITAWVRSGTAGNVVKLGFGESAATEVEKTFTINAVNTWQKIYWDISNLTNSNCTGGDGCNAVTRFRVTSTANSNTVYFDNINAQSYLSTSTGSAMTSTANNYIQYRAILSTTSVLATPTFANVTINYTTAGGAQVVTDRLSDQNNVDQYNLTQHLNITQASLNTYKSIHTLTDLTSVTQNGNMNVGTGADGSITVNASTNINTTSLITGRSCVDGGDAVNYSVTTLTSTTATLNQAPSLGCLSVGDEILLINLQGTTTATFNVGNWETLRVQSIAQNVITFTTAKSNYYGDGRTDDSNLGMIYNAQRVMLQRVPNYTNVTVQNGFTFSPSAWNGIRGGVMFFRANGAVANDGTISAAATGYLGATSAQNGGYNYGGGGGGEAFCGLGGTGSTTGAATSGAGGGGSYTGLPGNGYCGGGGATDNGVSGGLGSVNQGGAGGGGSVYAGGGGGGYGTPGTGGAAYNLTGLASSGGTNSSGNAYLNGAGGGGGGGGTYGDINLNRLMFGSGGGGGGDYTSPDLGGVGGNGGGIIYIAGNSVVASGSLTASGATGGAGSCTNAAAHYSGGGGGGAGGSIKIVGNSVNLGTSFVTSTGGGAGTGCNNGSVAANIGGVGGSGIIAVNYSTSIIGSSSPSYNVASVPAYNYSVLISDEIPTPNATSYSALSWLADLNTYGNVEFQTRSGSTPNSTDGTWEGWKPITPNVNTLSLDNANTPANWVSSDPTLTAGAGDVTRSVYYYEDENENTAANTTKLTVGANANAYVERTITATNLTNYDYITLWARSTVAGNTIKVGIGENVSTEHEQIFNMDAANTWQKLYFDISKVPANEKDAIKLLRITALSNNYSLYFDNISADRYMTNAAGSPITSTPNNYLQYRAILTTANQAFLPKLYNVHIEWNNGFKVQQMDSNTVRLYNFTGSTQQMKLDVVAFGADLAEWYTVADNSIAAGDVVAMTGQLDDTGVPILRKSSGINDHELLGVISTNAGQTLGIQADNRRLLGLAGRVPVKIDPSSPAIKAGDALTSGSVDGTAQKAGFGQMVFGRAVQNWDPSKGNEILAIVNNTAPTGGSLQIADVTIQVANGVWQAIDNSTGTVVDATGAFANLVAANIKAGAITTNDLISQQMEVATANIGKLIALNTQTSLISPIPGGTNVTVQIGSEATPSGQFVIQNASGSAIASIDNLGNATFSGVVRSQNIDAIQAMLDQVATDQNVLLAATSSANLNATGSATIAELITSDLYVTGQAAVNSLSVTNNLTVGSDFVISEALGTSELGTSLNTLSGPLKLQSLALAPVEIMGGLVTIDTHGNMQIAGNLAVAGRIQSAGLTLKDSLGGQSSEATPSVDLLSLQDVNGNQVSSVNASGSASFSNLTTGGLTIASDNVATTSAIVNGIITTNATAGSATISAGVSEITIKNPKVTDYTLVYVTPTSSTQNNVLYVKSKQAGQFVVGFTTAINVDANFNWWIVQVTQ